MIEPPVFARRVAELSRKPEPDYLSPEYVAAAMHYNTPVIQEKPIMKIEFDTSASPLVLTFSMVPLGGLFVDEDDCLIQRGSDDDDSQEGRYQCWQLCDSSGEVDACSVQCYDHQEIKRILPRIKRIQF